MLARIPADVSKRLLILTCAAALVSAGCSKLPTVNVQYGSGVTFVPYVADNLDDAGLGNAIALDKDGLPYASYLIFPAVLEEGEIAVPRPIGAPFITTGGDNPKDGAAVGVTNVSEDGVWTRGAAAQVPVTNGPAGITVPYGPVSLDGLVGATSENTNGTDIAIDANGGKHVVWAGDDGVWYAGGAGSFSEQLIQAWTPALQHAGPIGRPSVAVDDSGQPWVAYAIDSAKGQEVRVATTSNGTKWTIQTVATIPFCSGCPQPGPTQIAVTADGPLVVYVDGASGALMAATQSGNTWKSGSVETAAVPSGVSLIVSNDGTPWVSYYAADAVNVATSSGSGWTVAKVADAKPGDGKGNAAETTGVAVDDSGTLSVAWYDDATHAVVLASGDDPDSLKMVQTPGTEGGAFPSLAVAGDGSRLFLAWYDVETQDLLIGILGEATDVLVAQPSPTPQLASPSASGGPSCPKSGINLEAPAGAGVDGFAEKSLTGTASDDLTICFDNQDPSVQHNVDVYDQQNGTSLAAGNVIIGPAQELLDVSALKPGSYFYQCDIHPTVMTGTLTVK
jgi:plastocyanin